MGLFELFGGGDVGRIVFFRGGGFVLVGERGLIGLLDWARGLRFDLCANDAGGDESGDASSLAIIGVVLAGGEDGAVRGDEVFAVVDQGSFDQLADEDGAVSGFRTGGEGLGGFEGALGSNICCGKFL